MVRFKANPPKTSQNIMPLFWTPRKAMSKTFLQRINPYLLERTPKAKAVWEKAFKLKKQTWSSLLCPVPLYDEWNLESGCIGIRTCYKVESILDRRTCIHKHPRGPEMIPLQQRKHVLQQQNNLLGRVFDNSILLMFLALFILFPLISLFINTENYFAGTVSGPQAQTCP